MNNKTIWVLWVTALFAALIAAAAFWHHEHQALNQLQTQVVAGEVQPIVTLLNGAKVLAALGQLTTL